MIRRLAGALLLGVLCIAGFRAVVPPSSANMDPDDFGLPAAPAWSAPSVVAPPPGSTVPELSPEWEACTTGSTLIGRVTTDVAVARGRPSRSAFVIGRFARMNIYGAPQVINVVETVRAPGGGLWHRALLPVRPNGTTGFIRSTSVELLQTSYRLEVDRAKFELKLWNGCRLERRYPIGIGTGRTPTPVGRFYLVALLKPPAAGSVYGSYAYGLSAFSDHLPDWQGGGVIGLHGTNDPSSIGKRSSHGCIRMRNRDIASLAEILPLGTPIEIG